MAIEKPGGAPDGEGGSASLYLADANLRRLLGRADPALTRRWEPTLTLAVSRDSKEISSREKERPACPPPRGRAHRTRQSSMER